MSGQAVHCLSRHDFDAARAQHRGAALSDNIECSVDVNSIYFMQNGKYNMFDEIFRNRIVHCQYCSLI